MSNLIRVPQNYAVNFGYANVKQTLQALGEECIVLSMYHVNTDANTQPRCGICYDDVYKNNEDPNCTYCYGTTFQGGVKEAWRVWAIFTDETQDEKISKTGVWQDKTHSVQTEAYPPLEQNDYIIRVLRWDTNRQEPLEIGSYYKMGPVQPVSVRTGNRYGQTNEDRIAQKFTADFLPKTHVIYNYDVREEVTFPRYDQQPR
jgi:hypothetical protein